MDSLIADAANDPDRSLRVTLLALIADHDGLSDAQRDSLFTDAHYQQLQLQRRLQRAKLLALLGASVLPDELFAQCISFTDAPVHRALLDHPGINRLKLEALRDHGANRAIRNVAAQKLRSRARC